MVEPLDAVVADGAVRGSGRTEDLAGEAVLQLHRLVADEDLLGPGRGPVRCPVAPVRLDLDLTLRVPSFVLGGAGNYACKIHTRKRKREREQ